MDNIKIHFREEQGKNFLDEIRRGHFLFSFVISYTKTCEISGITFAGADKESIKYTPPADAEFLHYGFCKTIRGIPMTPDGKPSPALLTKTALDSASIPHFVINAGSVVPPKLPYFFTGLSEGRNIEDEEALDSESFVQALDYGRIVGRSLASVTDCLIIGESIPGGTTTALGVLRGLGYDAKVSSSIPNNPVELKKQVVEKALTRLDSKDPSSIVTKMGDPMIPFVAGMLSTASEIGRVILAGGTQMAAVVALGNHLKFKAENVAICTTSYIINDDSANFVELVKQISSIPVISIDPKLDLSKIDGINAFSKGFAKEGVGAGGALIAASIKTGMDTNNFIKRIEKEHERVSTLQ
ncbi:MAG: TIGR00303 family protein [Nitrosopumilaceae archaeon]|nr:TIGR00303 family protein [Nitrosopumilaceae archaeon]NIU00506.1 TIGR00303 family protein [Nitrosopumilaceae archaeon]NIU86889.1 TIGR00303 family protein [Nitrosopumilaceae archaeon]NIV65569.1 TIGR00303 family protein [Nitrosopumilaceae archaeon]NIX61108.1 TIGR00303 family protein [Nitrosopumilaceae archaeon]